MSTEHILGNSRSVDELEPTEMAPLSASTGSDFVSRPSAAPSSSLIFTHNGNNIVIPARTALLIYVATIVVILALIVGKLIPLSSSASPPEEFNKIDDQLTVKQRRDAIPWPIKSEIEDQKALMDELEMGVLDEIQRNETLLFLTTRAGKVDSQTSSRQLQRRGQSGEAVMKLFALITDQNVYLFKYVESEIWWANVYKFKSILSNKEIEMLTFINNPRDVYFAYTGMFGNIGFTQQLNALPVLGKCSIVQSIVSPTFAPALPTTTTDRRGKVVQSSPKLRGMHLPDTVVSEARQKLESILQLIPGSKKQETDWEPLHGMFGDLWYNAKTKQLSDFPDVLSTRKHRSVYRK